MGPFTQAMVSSAAVQNALQALAVHISKVSCREDEGIPNAGLQVSMD